MAKGRLKFLPGVIVIYFLIPFMACLAYKVAGFQQLVPLGCLASIVLMTLVAAFSISGLGVSRKAQVVMTALSFIVSIGVNWNYFDMAIQFCNLLGAPPLDLM